MMERSEPAYNSYTPSTTTQGNEPSPASEDSSNNDSKKRKTTTQQPPSRKHSRVLAACDACRISKTRCDSARPVCAKCVKRGIQCVYPDKDLFSIFESWGVRILNAVEQQERLLSEIVQTNKECLRHQQTAAAPQIPVAPQPPEPSLDDADLEAISRHDALRTPITGANAILDWPIFPREKPVCTFPPEAYGEKPDRFPSTGITSMDPARMLELRDIYMRKIQIKNPIVDADQLDAHIGRVLEKGFDRSPSSCLVLLTFALAAIWGNYPEDDLRTVTCESGPYSTRQTYVTLSVPDDRMRESLTYLSMARERMSSAYLDDSLLGVVCFCLFGMWYQYNIEPIPGWKMFRTASMLWESYNVKHRNGDTQRSKQEESLEQRLYWTCLKSECEVRYELPDLPPCNLAESDFPFSLPTFPMTKSYEESTEDILQRENPSNNAPAVSYYYYLAEISLRRLLNRARNAVTNLSPTAGPQTIRLLDETIPKLMNQLQQWLDCLPPSLRFNIPLKSRPPPNEPELVKLVRERYVEVRELLHRAYLYVCLHAGNALTREQAEAYGAKASEALLLSVYRIQTENPFFRHPGSWGACRVRFNHALCLVAAFRAKVAGVPSAEYVTVPSAWADCVRVVIERLKQWSEEGAGIKELSILLEWAMHGLA